jgi:hypothetical protein
VGIMVHHGISQIVPTYHFQWQYHIGVIFLGGPDDREVITIASQMICHPKVYISLLRFYIPDMIENQKKEIEEQHDVEEAMDCRAIEDFQKNNIDNERLILSETTTVNIEQIVSTLYSFGTKHDLVLVGRRRGPSSMIISVALEKWVESPELGVIGDLLTSSNYENRANILVVQKNNSG